MNKCSVINRNNCLLRNEMHVVYNVTSIRFQIFDFCTLITWPCSLIDWGHTFCCCSNLYVYDGILLVLLESVIVFAGLGICLRLFWWIYCSYRGADKSLARPSSRCILFDGENIYFDASLVIYTGCPGRNVPDFGRMFLKLKYTDITQNTYSQSWTVTEIMAGEVW